MKKQSHQLSDDLLQEFSNFISNKIGMVYSRENWRELENKLIPLSQELGFEDLGTCLRWFMHTNTNSDLMDLLIDHLTIGETYFFRDSSLFKMLEEFILPSLIYKREKKDKFLRIWCAACATGEEPYSIAILLKRLMMNLPEWSIKILGSDINPFFYARLN